MAVTVKFWSFSKKKNSTKVPTGSPSYSYDCQLKTEATLTEPVIELNTGAATGCSYAQISDFGRYYFIREWRFDRGLWTAYLEVDVLASYKSQIGSQSLYVTRSASSYDGDIKDMFYPTTDAVTNYEYTIRNADSFSGGVFVVGILGTQVNTGGIVYYQMDHADMATLMNTLLTNAYGEFSGSGYVDGVINSLMNPLQYIASCRWYPSGFITDNTNVGTIYAGRWPCDGLNHTYKITGALTWGSLLIPLGKHPKAATRGSYLNLAPYTRYGILWGSYYELDASVLAKETYIAVENDRDFTSTESLLRVFAGSTSGQPILTVSVPWGIDIPLTQASTSPTGVASAVGGFVGATIGALTMNAGAVVAGAAAMIGGVADSVNPTISSTQIGSGLTVACQPKKLVQSFYDVVEDDLADFGRPLMKTKTISTLSGFVRCQNDDITISCLDTERTMIRTYLTGGFFYE